MNVILVYESSSLFFECLVNIDVGTCGLLVVLGLVSACGILNMLILKVSQVFPSLMMEAS